MEIIRGKLQAAQKTVVYGPEGIGKSTFASQFPEPLFIDTEGSTTHMDVSRLPKPTSWSMLLEEVRYVINTQGLCKTLVVDTADWAEALCISEICARNHWSGIEDPGYGKGYVYLADEFGKLLNLLSELTEKGINIVITAHAMMRKFEQPDELGAYDRWELKLQKKTAPLLKEWADMVLFANYKTLVVNVDGKGAQKGKNKAQGGQRIMYTSHHSCWDAKNRHGLSEEIPFEFASIAHLFIKDQNKAIPSPIQNQTAAIQPVKEEFDINQQFMDGIVEERLEPGEQVTAIDYTGIPQALMDLMKKDNVLPDEIRSVVSQKGYYPYGTPIENYDPEFIKGVLVGAWPQVFDMIKQERKLPF